MSRPAWIVVALLGVALRMSILPLRVPPVDDSWRAWTYHTTLEGPARMYGPRGHVVTFGDIEAPVVYPPLALDEMAVIGRVYRAVEDGAFPDGVGLTIAIKMAVVLFDAALTAVIFFSVRSVAGMRAASWGAAAYWLNPAILMATTLGYVDALVALPAVAALVAASAGRSWLAGGLCAAAVMTKPQGILVAPAVALALWNAGTADTALRRITEAAAACAVVVALLIAPLVAAGTLYFMLRSVAVLAGHNMLSATAFNVWWVVSYAADVVALRAHGLAALVLAHPSVLPQAAFAERGLPHPRLMAALLLGPTVAWALWAGLRARDLGLQAALAALIVDAYFTWFVQVHENHFFLVIPLLVIAAALRPAFGPVLMALSISFALSLYLVLGGDGNGPPELAISFTGIDSTILLSMINCGLFIWLAAVFARAAAD